jgi:hypothetical protein
MNSQVRRVSNSPATSRLQLIQLERIRRGRAGQFSDPEQLIRDHTGNENNRKRDEGKELNPTAF